MKNYKCTIIFYILLFLSLFAFIRVLLSPNIETVAYSGIYSHIYNPMNVIIETKENNADFILKLNDDFLQIPKSKNVLNKSILEKAETLDILVLEGSENKARGILIFNGTKPFYYKDFSAFQKSSYRLCPNGVCNTYNAYKVPNEIKYNKNASSYNYHSNLNTACVIFMALMSACGAFLLPYLLFFIAILFYASKKEKILLPKIPYMPFICTALIFISGTILRFNGLFDYLPFNDEFYTLDVSDPEAPLIKAFCDPGNPGFFYLILKVYFSIFQISPVSLKMFPFIISILSIFSLWYFLKKRFDLKTANIGAFLLSINVPLIYQSPQVRSYIFQAFLTPVIVYYLFEILDKNKKKDYIIYSILTAIASNTHYYEILFLGANFIYAAIYLLIQKRHKDIFKFFMANLIGAIPFIVYFCGTSLNKALLNTHFNDWIPDISPMQIGKCVSELFSGVIPIVLCIVYFVKSLFKKQISKKDEMIIYSFFTIFTVILFAVILSYAIRPMLVERYLTLLIPLVIILLTMIFLSFNKKYALCFSIIIILMMGQYPFKRNFLQKGLIEQPFLASYQYLEQNKTELDKNVYIVLNSFVTKKSLDLIKAFKVDINEGVNQEFVPLLDVQERIDEILEENKNAVIFTSILPPDKKNFFLPDNYTCYFSTASDMCLWKIEN